MKNTYETPEFEVLNLTEITDVIATSGECDSIDEMWWDWN